MAKRRYSEDFYNEIDALIKIQHEKSTQRFQVLEFTYTNSNEEEKSQDKPAKKSQKRGYTPPPSFWTVVKQNKLLAMIMIFIGITLTTLIVSSVLAGGTINRNGQNNSLALNGDDNIMPEIGRKKTINYQIHRENLDTVVQPVPKSWPQPSRGRLEPFRTNQEKLQAIPNESFQPAKEYSGEPLKEDNEKQWESFSDNLILESSPLPVPADNAADIQY